MCRQGGANTGNLTATTVPQDTAHTCCTWPVVLKEIVPACNSPHKLINCSLAGCFPRPAVFVLSWPTHVLTAAPHLTHSHRKKTSGHIPANVELFPYINIFSTCVYVMLKLLSCILLKANWYTSVYTTSGGLCSVFYVCARASHEERWKVSAEVINTPFTHKPCVWHIVMNTVFNLRLTHSHQTAATG